MTVIVIARGKVFFRLCVFLLAFLALAAPRFGLAASAEKAEEGGEAPRVVQNEGLEELKFDVDHPESVPTGEPFVVRCETNGNFDFVEISWNGKTIPLSMIQREQVGGRYVEVLLPMPLNPKEKSLPLVILAGEVRKTRIYSANIKVTQREYPVQHLQVAPKYVSPKAEDQARIEAESKKNRAILTTINPESFWKLPFERPVPGIITSEFGFKRMFNKQPRSQHKGVDFRSPMGGEVKACADGWVVLAEEQYFSGNVVIIDHGLGVYSLYAHLNEFVVFSGDFVQAGELIGLSGKTGRVTGPHLHFGLTVQGESVTPEPFMKNFRPAKKNTRAKR
ncbi:M23 family metallopeptidase [Desulfovibrio sp. OttesenSCG-928-C14]|nr:M23 family metallopeptidase [Desulfovibrio sp. OttesenSCG-928-C14]